MLIFQKNILITFLLITCFYCNSQLPHYKLIPSEYELEHIKLNSKDATGLINDMIEDKQGYLWLASMKGLHVFDGSNTITYSHNNKQFHLVIDSTMDGISSITKTATNNFWIKDGPLGMALFDPIKRKVLKAFNNQSTNNKPLHYYSSSQNNCLYFPTSNIQKNTMHIWQKKDNSNPELIYTAFNLQDIYFTKFIGNHHWIFEKNRLLKISQDGKKLETYNLPTSFLWYFASEDNTKFYFLDVHQNAIYTYNEQQNKIEVFLTLPDNLKGKGPYLYVDSNTVYFGNNLSLFIIDKQNKTIQNLSSSFIELAKKEAPNNLAVDFQQYFKRKDGSILVCTQSDIYRLKKKLPTEAKFLQPINPVNSISQILSCRAIAEDENKNIYISYYTGIVKKNTNSNNYTALDLRKYIAGAPLSTYSLHYWRNNLLWNNVSINLANNKLTFLFGNKYGGHVTQYLHNDSLWLFKWDTNELHCYDLNKKKNTTYYIDVSIEKHLGNIAEMNDMVGDATGQNLWVSTTYHGISLITKKGELIKQYTFKDLGISDNKVTDLELSGDYLWFGCSDGLGVLHVLTGKTMIFKNPVTVNNTILQNRVIFSILNDGAGNFYLGSSHGLLLFNITERKFYNLAEDHPLAKLECNRASAFKASNGTYYFGSTDGLFCFKANELQFLKPSNVIAPLKLYRITVFNNKKGVFEYTTEDLDSLKNWILQPYHNSIEFSFSVPEFYKKIYYSYRVKGQSDIWTDYKPDNKIILYGLAPGKYQLEVKASTSLSDDNANLFVLTIEMKQVWYKKGWVIALLVLGGLVTTIVFLRHRFNQKLKRQKELATLRTKISSDLHDNVGTLLSGLSMQSQMLSYSAKEEQKKSLLEISSMSRDAMEHMRDTVWAIDSRKDKYENLVDRMRDFAEKNLAMKKLTHQFIITELDTKKFIDPEKRQAIYLIFKEAITNIIKHSDGNQVLINFAEHKNKICLTIHDNGNEKPLSNSDGLGMSNMKMRAEKMRGTLTAKYENGFLVELDI